MGSLFSFLPHSLGPELRGFVIVVILLHVAAVLYWVYRLVGESRDSKRPGRNNRRRKNSDAGPEDRGSGSRTPPPFQQGFHRY